MKINVKELRARIFKEEEYEQYEEAGNGSLYLLKNKDEDVFALLFKCPNCGKDAAVNIRLKGEKIEYPTWFLTNWPDSPTLHPSLQMHVHCEWHGWLKDGIWKSC